MVWPRFTKPPSSKLSRTIRSVTGAASVTCSLASAVPTASIRSTKRMVVAGAAFTRGAGRSRSLALPPSPQAASKASQAARRQIVNARTSAPLSCGGAAIKRAVRRVRIPRFLPDL
jgi:hypothetical protein